MNAVRVLFLAHAVVALLFGIAFVAGAGPAMSSLGLGEPTLPVLLFIRSEGVAFIAFAVVNLFTPGMMGLPLVRAVASANVILHLGMIAVDFTETYARNAGVWAGLAVHAVFALAFLYCLVRSWRAKA